MPPMNTVKVHDTGYIQINSSLRCLSDSETPIAVHQKPLSTLSVLVHHIPSSPLYYHLYEGIIRIARAEAT